MRKKRRKGYQTCFVYCPGERPDPILPCDNVETIWDLILVSVFAVTTRIIKI